MGKIGRNDPCPCGSGKKFKKCCLPLQQDTPPAASPLPKPIGSTPGAIAFYDDIDQLSNSVPDLIKDGKLQEAENVCKQLSIRYPDQVDGIERMAMVEEARGNFARAAELYSNAAAFVRANPGFDPDTEHGYTELAEQMKAKSRDS
jgi:SEC-C motif